jgi:hypothetical protein
MSGAASWSRISEAWLALAASRREQAQLRQAFQQGGDMSILHRPHLGSRLFLRALEMIIASADLILIPLSAASVP